MGGLLERVRDGRCNGVSDGVCIGFGVLREKDSLQWSCRKA